MDIPQSYQAPIKTKQQFLPSQFNHIDPIESTVSYSRKVSISSKAVKAFLMPSITAFDIFTASSSLD